MDFSEDDRYGDENESNGYDELNSDVYSDLEDIENELYCQIHFEMTEKPVINRNELSEMGPKGDNSESQFHLNPELPPDNSESICDMKSLSGTEKEVSLIKKKVSVSKKKVKCKKGKVRKQSVLVKEPDKCIPSGKDGPVQDEDFFVINISSDSDCKEDQEITQDIKLNIEDNEVDPLWAVITDDVYTETKRFSSRYYKPINVRCRNCSERGHLSQVCPRPKKDTICYMCGETGHNNRSCTNVLCFNCQQVGHTSRECPRPSRRTNDVCHRCEMRGHIQMHCPDLWRQYHLTIDDGDLIKGRAKSNPRIYCHNCGKKGHFGFECEKDLISRYSQPVYPFVARYQKLSEKQINKCLQDDIIYLEEDQDRQPKEKTKKIRRKAKSKNSVNNKKTLASASVPLVSTEGRKSNKERKRERHQKFLMKRTAKSKTVGTEELMYRTKLPDKKIQTKKEKRFNAQPSHKRKALNKDITGDQKTKKFKKRRIKDVLHVSCN